MTRLGSLSAFSAFGVFWGAWAVLLPEVKAQTGASVAELGVALLFVAAAALPTMFATGLLLDRFGPRILPVSAVFFGLAVLLPGLADSVWQLVLALIVVGAASGALDVSINFGATSIEACGGAPIMFAASITLLRESGRIFLEGAPSSAPPEDVGGAIVGHEGVVETHDLHVWTVTDGFPALSAHVLVEPGADCHRIRLELERMLAERFGLEHTTLQVEHVGAAKGLEIRRSTG